MEKPDETSNLESVSSSENAESKVNMKSSQTNKFNEPTGSEKAVQLQKKEGRINNDEDLSEQPSHSSDENDDSKGSLGNKKEIATQRQKKEVGVNNNCNKLREEPSKPLDKLKEEVKDSSADNSDDSEPVEHDVKVCDICGDAGREDLLAICCRCPDGAEHTYCMKLMLDEVPEGDWLCEECKLEEEKVNLIKQRYGSEAAASEKAQSSVPLVEEQPRSSNRDPSALKASGKRRLEESESFSALKKQALEVNTSSPRKVKSSHHISSDSLFNDSSETVRSPTARPQLQSLRGSLMKSNSFNYPNPRSKTKLVDEVILQRQKSTKERSLHDPIVPKEMGKSMSFRSTNLGGRFGPSGSKVKMLSPNSSHVQDPKSLKNKKERSFERVNSVKLPPVGNSSTSSATASTPKVEKITPLSSASNFETKPLKGDNKTISGQKSINRTSNISAEIPVSQGQFNKPASSSPTGGVTSSSSGTIEQKSVALKDENSLKLPTTKESSTNLTDVVKETATKQNVSSLQTHASDKPNSVNLNNSSSIRTSKDVKNRDNKLKDAIEAALLKKPGIYRKNRVSDQPDESSVSNVNNEPAAVVDRTPLSRSLTSNEMLPDWQGQISRNSILDHSKQSNGKHSTTELPTLDATSLSSSIKTPAIPDHDYIWQGSFEINRSGKTAEFWDGLQAHLSSCASPKVYEAVNKLPHKILLNGVSRVSAWPEQFENNGAKEDNIAIYFFAKDIESYEKSYQVLLDDMIRSDLALIGSINGVELLIFPSNQLPEKFNRWNMLFFLWGVFRGQKNNSLNKVPENPEKNCNPQITSSISADKNSSPENVCPLGSKDKDKQIDSEAKVNSDLQNSTNEKSTDNINPIPPVTNTPFSNKPGTQDVVKYTRNPKPEQHRPFTTEIPPEELKNQAEPKKRPFIDLSDDVDFPDTSQPTVSWPPNTNTRNIKQKNDTLFDKKEESVTNNDNNNNNTNGERFFFPVLDKPKFKLALDLNEDIEEDMDEEENTMMTKKEEVDDDADVASSLSLSLSFPHADKDEEDRGKGRNRNSSSMLLFRDIVDK